MSVHVHPCWGAEAWEINTRTAGPCVTEHRFLVGEGEVLLRDSEDVQGETAGQGNLELVHVREPGKQHRRDEGVRAQEKESVAGVVVVIVGRGPT